MADVLRALRGAWPGPSVAAALRALMLTSPLRYGHIGEETAAGIDYAARVLALSPIAYYELDEASGTTATDTSGNAHNGTYSGAAPGGTGIGDGQTGATFDGTGDDIDIHTMGALFSGAAGSVMVWAKTAAWADATARFLVRIAASSTHQVFIQKSGVTNQLVFRRQAGVAGSKSVGDTSLVGSTDYFCAVLTWDTGADALKAYINGVQVGTTQTGLAAFVGSPAATTTVIGASDTAGALSWSGNLAHVAIFDRALSAAEVLSLGTIVPASSSLLTDLVAYWKLNEASGTRLDITGRGNDLAPTSAPGSTTGKVGNAAQFDGGVPSLLSIASNADVSIATGESWHTAFWVKVDTMDSAQYLLLKSDGDTYEYEIFIGDHDGMSPGRITFDNSPSNVVKTLSIATIEEATWYFVEAIYDAGTDEIGIALNGSAFVRDDAFSDPYPTNAGPLEVGGHIGATNSFAGEMDEVGIWKRLLTSGERAALYNAGAGTTYPFSS